MSDFYAGRDDLTLDTRLSLKKPERPEIELRCAGPFVRALALVLDEFTRWILLAFAASALGSLGALTLANVFLTVGVVYWGYGVAFEVFAGGQTPGKRMLHIVVVNGDGTAIRLGASLIRNLLLIVDILPLFYLFGLLTMLVSRHFRRVGDLLAGTLVVYREPAPSTRMSGAASTAVSLRLDAAEQRVVLAFDERTSRMSAERARELANLLAPVLGCRDDEAVAQMRRLASALRGDR